MRDNLHFAENGAPLQSSIPGLHATSSAPLPFLKDVVVRSFFIERAQGNILIYNAPGITAAAREIEALGKPTRLLVNHWHEAMYDPPGLDVPIFVHEKDREKTDLPIAGSFAKRERIGDDLEIIPTPGHTSGTTMFLWNSGEHRVLFPGDSIWVEGGIWKAVLLEESHREAYLATLQLLMELEFDILVPWGSKIGEPYGYGVTPSEARGYLGAIFDRLKAGEHG